MTENVVLQAVTDGTEGIIVRGALSQDRSAIEVIMSTYFLDIEDIPISDFVVALLGQRVLGAACMCKGKVIEVHSIAVHPNHRKKGIGRMLLEALTSQLTHNTLLYTRTTAPMFFERTGFQKLEASVKSEIWDDCASCDKLNACTQSVLCLKVR